MCKKITLLCIGLLFVHSIHSFNLISLINTYLSLYNQSNNTTYSDRKDENEYRLTPDDAKELAELCKNYIDGKPVIKTPQLIQELEVFEQNPCNYAVEIIEEEINKLKKESNNLQNKSKN